MSYFIDRTFVNELSQYLTGLVNVGADLWKARCPFCGDSHRRKHLKRFYIYRANDDSRLNYICHNCGAAGSLKYLIKTFDNNLFIKYVFEKFGKKDQIQKIDEIIVPEKKNLLFNFGIRLSELTKEETHPAIQYFKQRQIPLKEYSYFSYVDDFSKLSEYFPEYEDRELPSDDRIIIPYYDRGGNLIAVQGRALTKTKMRYVTLKHDKNMPLIFGLERVDFNKLIYCTEGAFDSLFLPNSVAVSGSDFSKINGCIPSNRVLLLDNQPRNKEVCAKYLKFISLGENIVIWNGNEAGKDINELIIQGISKTEILEIIQKRTFSGLKAYLEFMKWKKV